MLFAPSVCSSASWDERFAVTPEQYKDDKTGELKKWNGNANVCKAWKAQQNGKQIISAEDHEEALNACAALFGDTRISDLTFKAARQVFVLAEYHDRATNITVPFKVLIDLVPHVENARYGKALSDFKTGRNAGPMKWAKEVFERWYHVQAACYLDAYTAATGEDRVEFRHVISENVPPYQTARRVVSEEFISMGRATYIDALKYYCGCLAMNDWPDYECTRDTFDGWTFTQPESWMLMRESVPRPVIESEPQRESEPVDAKGDGLFAVKITPNAELSEQPPKNL